MGGILVISAHVFGAELRERISLPLAELVHLPEITYPKRVAVCDDADLFSGKDPLVEAQELSK